MWLAVASDQGQLAARIVFEHWGRGLDPQALSQALGTVDLDAESAACPACGSRFPPSAGRCPECGLRIG